MGAARHDHVVEVELAEAVHLQYIRDVRSRPQTDFSPLSPALKSIISNPSFLFLYILISLFWKIMEKRGH